MNAGLTFLQENWRRLRLESYCQPNDVTCLIKTPRFRASSHVIFIIIQKGKTAPFLVIKMPRIAGVSSGIQREAANLAAVQASRPGGFDSIPRVVTFEEYAKRWTLVETAIAGQAMDPVCIRQNLEVACQTTCDWLLKLQRPSMKPNSTDTTWYDRLVRQPLKEFADRFPMGAAEQQYIHNTLAVLAPLQSSELPLVFEHGDLSHPNLLVTSKGELGVVDWELAEPNGLPGHDLFFFLSYAASARQTTSNQDNLLQAARQAFFSSEAWTLPYIHRYGYELGIEPEVLERLFLLCWVRYTANLVIRITDSNNPSCDHLDDETLSWLRSNRYYLLWLYTLEQFDQIKFKSCISYTSQTAFHIR